MNPIDPAQPGDQLAPKWRGLWLFNQSSHTVGKSYLDIF